MHNEIEEIFLSHTLPYLYINPWTDGRKTGLVRYKMVLVIISVHTFRGGVCDSCEWGDSRADDRVRMAVVEVGLVGGCSGVSRHSWFLWKCERMRLVPKIMFLRILKLVVKINK